MSDQRHEAAANLEEGDADIPQIRVERAGSVATVVVSHPTRRNAFTVDMLARFPQVLRELDGDDTVRVIVLTGAGEAAFISGADISEFEKERSDPACEAAFMRVVDAALLAPALCEKPVIAGIRGACIGGGLQIAAACDIRIAADDALFMMPAARLGVGYPYSGMSLFHSLIGRARTADLFFSARRVHAPEALALGLVNRVVAAASLKHEVEQYAAAVAANAPLTLRAVKASLAALSGGIAMPNPPAIQERLDRCWGSKDFTEGRTAFMQKRKPDFQGR